MSNGNNNSPFNGPPSDTPPRLVELPRGHTTIDVAKVLVTLGACKTKLRIYREKVGPEYVGGMEYSALMRSIEELEEAIGTAVAMQPGKVPR